MKRKSLTVAKGNCTPCLSNNRAHCYRQIIKATMCQVTKTKGLKQFTLT